jgi:hypothetical protein
MPCIFYRVIQKSLCTCKNNKCLKWEIIQKRVLHKSFVPPRACVCTGTFVSLPIFTGAQGLSNHPVLPFHTAYNHRRGSLYHCQAIMIVYSSDRGLRSESFFAVPLYVTAIVANNIDNRFFVREFCYDSATFALCVYVSFTFLRFQFYCPLSNGAGKCTV